jgi:hypothetical protein
VPRPHYPVTLEIAKLAGKIEGEQAARGVSISFEDLLIGTTALYLGYSVATLNSRHFRLIPGLSVVQASAKYKVKDLAGGVTKTPLLRRPTQNCIIDPNDSIHHFVGRKVLLDTLACPFSELPCKFSLSYEKRDGSGNLRYVWSGN